MRMRVLTHPHPLFLIFMEINTMERFVLSSMDDDSILASKIIIHMHRDCSHLSANRSKMNLDMYSDLTFIRPYFKTSMLTASYGYGANHKCTLIDFSNSEHYQHKDLLEKAGVECIWVDPKSSLSEAVWAYTYYGELVPEIVRLTRDYIKWELKIDDSLLVHYGLSIIDARLTAPVTEMYMALLDGDEEAMGKLVTDGTEIYQFMNEHNKELSKEIVFTGTLDDHNVLCANISRCNSLFFSDRLDLDANIAAVLMIMDVVRRKVRHTLFRIDDESSMYEIAKAHGGGGQEGSAGFVEPNGCVIPSFSETPAIDYNILLGDPAVPNSVRRYVAINQQVRKFDTLSTVYMGRKVLIANTPYLTREFMFGECIVWKEDLFVTYCLRADGRYRVTISRNDLGDPGDEYGKKFGVYRIEILDKETLRLRLGDDCLFS